ncbi:MAG: class I SAM-dependent methyltransferase [Caldimonas sp.]
MLSGPENPFRMNTRMIETPKNSRPVPYPVAFALHLRSLLTDVAHKLIRRRRRTRAQVQADYDKGEWRDVMNARYWDKVGDLETYVFTDQERQMAAQVDGRLRYIAQRDYYRYRTSQLNGLLAEFDLQAPRLVEVGCGAGRNLFCAAASGRWKEIRGLDLSPTGIEIVKTVASRFGLPEVSAGPIDLLDPKSPGFDEIRDQVCFTYHCLEQLPAHTGSVLRNLADASPRRVIHIEPTRELFSLASLKDWASISYLWRQNYLADLVTSARRLEREGVLRVIAIRRLEFAPTLRNSPTLLVWEPVRRES